MTTTETWWETIFEGNLSLGLNKERISDLEDETFLYYGEMDPQVDSDQIHLKPQ
ncbi:hypothetical protein QWT69_10090 [Sporosarcina oncorhynchi]|uniref:Uncharacterized protein n=1 Tax=Sporosarcina oncorhynchi TaxID=3056444 RepID=A0ABZ0L3Z0_9BACL|nr:hypothetical protein [Sporosarcina sp. T2O-4]WOV86291.1 hypothetical protein QWT69_10090 [Sporosarcina sp. T2O-4]